MMPQQPLLHALDAQNGRILGGACERLRSDYNNLPMGHPPLLRDGRGGGGLRRGNVYK